MTRSKRQQGPGKPIVCKPENRPNNVGSRNPQ
jgi:hypothetical protein